MSDFKNEFYTVKEVCELLKIHRNTVGNLMKEGKIEYYKVGKQIRISAKELEKMKISATN